MLSISFLHVGRFQDHRTLLKLTNIGDLSLKEPNGSLPCWKKLIWPSLSCSVVELVTGRDCPRQRPEEGLNHSNSNSVYMRHWAEWSLVLHQCHTDLVQIWNVVVLETSFGIQVKAIWKHGGRLLSSTTLLSWFSWSPSLAKLVLSWAEKCPKLL